MMPRVSALDLFNRGKSRKFEIKFSKKSSKRRTFRRNIVVASLLFKVVRFVSIVADVTSFLSTHKRGFIDREYRRPHFESNFECDYIVAKTFFSRITTDNNSNNNNNNKRRYSYFYECNYSDFVLDTKRGKRWKKNIFSSNKTYYETFDNKIHWLDTVGSGNKAEMPSSNI